MSFGMIVRTVFEMALIGFTLWAVFHEDRFAAFEQRLFARLRRRRLRVVRGSRAGVTVPVRER